MEVPESADVETDERKKEESRTTVTPQTPGMISVQSTSGVVSVEESIFLAASPAHFRFEESKFPSEFHWNSKFLIYIFNIISSLYVTQ